MGANYTAIAVWRISGCLQVIFPTDGLSVSIKTISNLVHSIDSESIRNVNAGDNQLI